MLPLNQGPAASSQGPAASANSEDENTEKSDEFSARSQDSGRTLLDPDLYFLTNDEHWTAAPETQVCSCSRVILFVTTPNVEQQDVGNLTTIPSVQRSLCIEEVTDDSSSRRVELPNGVDNQTRNMLARCMATCGKAAGGSAKMRSRARKEASAQEVRGNYKQFAEAKHLEWKSWIENEVFDLVDLRKFKPKNYVTSRWVLTIKKRQAATPQGKSKMGTERIPRQTKGLPADRFSSFYWTWISDELPSGSEQKLGIF